MNKNGTKLKKKGKVLASSAAAANPASTPSGNTASRTRIVATGIFLAAITFAVFGQTVRFGFVNYDEQPVSRIGSSRKSPERVSVFLKFFTARY
jgi:hypothetical protein